MDFFLPLGLRSVLLYTRIVPVWLRTSSVHLYESFLVYIRRWQWSWYGIFYFGLFIGNLNRVMDIWLKFADWWILIEIINWTNFRVKLKKYRVFQGSYSCAYLHWKKMRKERVKNKKIRTSKEIQFFYNSDNFFQKNAPELEK